MKTVHELKAENHALKRSVARYKRLEKTNKKVAEKVLRLISRKDRIIREQGRTNDDLRSINLELNAGIDSFLTMITRDTPWYRRITSTQILQLWVTWTQ